MSINGLALGTNNISAQLATKLDIAGGKVLQVVRATDTTNRNTTSNSFVDASISVTITPQRNTSAILLIWTANTAHTGTSQQLRLLISDSSNNSLTGPGGYIGSTATTDFNTLTTIIGWATPATTSAVTYKGRFMAYISGTAALYNNEYTGQLYAIEVSA